ncbi:MAG: hypothetical protein E7653_00845 [Ruminococcaceae bacterium]|nr:hypothetical protein [Oscillospiraceae bacterium]
MALKMRFLYYSGKAKMKSIAEAVKVEFDLAQNANAIDIIPPAYSCQNERLVILAVSGKGDPDDILRRFCFELDKKKAQNVALLVDGDQKMADKLIETVKSAGTNLVGDVKFIKIGGLPFLGGKLNDDEKTDILNWVHGIVDQLQ